MLPYYDKKDFDNWLKDDKVRLEKEMMESTRQDEEERKRIKEKLEEKGRAKK